RPTIGILLLETSRFLLAQERLVGQVRRPLEGRQRPEVPHTLQARLAVRGSGNGRCRFLRGLRLYGHRRSGQRDAKRGGSEKTRSRTHPDLLFSATSIRQD